MAHANIDAIVSGLADAYAFMHMDDPPQQHHHQGLTSRTRQGPWAGARRASDRGGVAIAATSILDMQSMFDSLPGEKSVFLPYNGLIDSGAEINVCFDYNQFCCIGPSDIDECMPVGSGLA